MFVQCGKVQGLDRLLGFKSSKELPCCLGLFHDKMTYFACHGDDMLRQYLFRWGVAQRAGNQVERAMPGFHVQNSLTFSLRNIWINKISGSPINALGSSPVIALISAIPSPSDFALPAQ